MIELAIWAMVFMLVIVALGVLASMWHNSQLEREEDDEWWR